MAAQQNQTVHTPASTSTPTSTPAPSTSHIKQVQVGCASACFGTTSKGSSPGLGPHELSELVLALGVADSLPTTAPISGAVHNTVSQTSSQLQVGTGDAQSQTQSAAQANLTIQALGADLVANSTTQAIAQIQIGCLFYCHGTSQQQIATQSNTTVDVAPSAASVSTVTASAVSNVTDQLIWQLQIGCLMWCWDATQDQSASSDDALIELPSQWPPPPAQPSDPQQPPDPGPTAPSGPPPSVPAPSAPAAPPGATAPPPSLAPSPAFAATQSTSPPAAGANTPTPAGSAIDVGGVVSGSVWSGAWSESLSAAGWSVTEAASPARPAEPSGSRSRSRSPLPPSAGTVSVVRQVATSSTSFALGSAVHARRAARNEHRHGSDPAGAKPAGTAAIGDSSVDGGADRALELGLAAFALVGLLAGAVAWRRRIG